MSRKAELAWGIFGTLVLMAICELLPINGMLLLFLVATLSLASVLAGHVLPLFLRTFTTGSVVYLGYVMCLVGRTMGPGFTRDTAEMAMVWYGIFAALPNLALLRIWKGWPRIIIVAGALPLGLLLACTVAGYEEASFVKQHPYGIGPTKRRTVSQHWLAYDAETKKLSGSD